MSDWLIPVLLMGGVLALCVYEAFKGEWADIWDETIRPVLAMLCAFVAVMIVILSNKGVI